MTDFFIYFAFAPNFDDEPDEPSLVFKLAARKFELFIIHQQKTTRKGWLFIGGSCKTRTCDQTVMSGLL